MRTTILQLLSAQDLAVIATVAPDGSPVATPVRYSSWGFDVVFSRAARRSQRGDRAILRSER